MRKMLVNGNVAGLPPVEFDVAEETGYVVVAVAEWFVVEPGARKLNGA
jgi:hypothetical protein